METDQGDGLGVLRCGSCVGKGGTARAPEARVLSASRSSPVTDPHFSTDGIYVGSQWPPNAGESFKLRVHLLKKAVAKYASHRGGSNYQQAVEKSDSAVSVDVCFVFLGQGLCSCCN